MKIIAAPDSFKESMTAAEAIAAMRRGVHQVLPDAEVIGCPMADGGEGSVQTLTEALGGEFIDVEIPWELFLVPEEGAGQDSAGHTPIRAHDANWAHAPIQAQDAIQAQFGWLPDRRLALIEVAAACGLELIAAADRDIFRASSAGVAELIRAALARGATQIIIGLGGSATNDGGAGLLQRLGGTITVAGSGVAPDPLLPGSLAQVDGVELGPVRDLLAGVEIVVASDVTNPLAGPRGASAVFGPQKGASVQDVAVLDRGLAHWGEVLAAAANIPSLATTPGAGAAGGIGAALLAAGATIRSGVELVMELVGLPGLLADADLILTGEGKIDSQTEQGKVLSGVLAQAQAAGVPAMAFGGKVEATELVGWAALKQITPPGQPLPQALANGAQNLEAATAAVLASYLRSAESAPDQATT